MKFKVTVCRTSFMEKDFDIEDADNYEEAQRIAMKMAYNMAFTLGDEVDHEYEVIDVIDVKED
jgi:hypothetical protein